MNLPSLLTKPKVKYLLSSKGIDEPVIYSGNINSISHLGNTIEVESGVKAQALSKYAYEKKLSGFEFLIGIPASIGGCVYMNAGAHGQTISDCLISAKLYDTENKKGRTQPPLPQMFTSHAKPHG